MAGRHVLDEEVTIEPHSALETRILWLKLEDGRAGVRCMRETEPVGVPPGRISAMLAGAGAAQRASPGQEARRSEKMRDGGHGMCVSD